MSWKCNMCTLENTPTSLVCEACRTQRSEAPFDDPVHELGTDETKHDDLPSPHVHHRPTVDSLQLRVTELVSELEECRRKSAEKDMALAAAMAAMDEMRGVVVEERQQRSQVVSELWATMRHVVQTLAPTGSKALPPDPVLEDVDAKIKAHTVVERWTAFAVERRQQRESFILAKCMGWIERAKAKVAERTNARATHDAMCAMLIDKKGHGLPLSVQEVNFLRVPEHKDGQLYDCGACFDEFPLESVLVLKCGHLLCQTCMRGFVVAEIQDGRYAELSCHETECAHKLDRDDVQLALGSGRAALFKRYEELMLEEHLTHDPNLIRCPKPRCQTPMIKGPTTTMVLCPKCEFSFCGPCGVEWHADTTCEKYQAWVKENGAADDLYEKWAAQNSKICPREEKGCGRPIQKNGGCNHMTCKCGNTFCWLCMKHVPRPQKFQHYKSGGACNGKLHS